MSGRQISIKEFSSFAARYAAVLDALYRQSDDEFTRSDLLRIASENADPEVSASPESVVRNLEEYRMVESADPQLGTYRYPRSLVDLHRHLAMLSEPVSAQSITANIDALAQAGADLRMGVASGDAGAARHAADEIRRLCNDVLRGVSENYRFILNEALELKKGDGTTSIRQRYEHLDHAWGRYIEPLRMIVLVQGSFTQNLSSVDGALDAAEKAGTLPDGEEVRVLRRLLGLVVQNANRSMADCLKTVQPLLDRLKRDGTVAHGAALGMAQFIKLGAIRTGILKLVPVVHVREQDRFSDTELSDVLKTLLSIKAAPPPMIPEVRAFLDSNQQVDVRFVAAAVACVEEAGSVPDLLTFIHEKFPDRRAFDCISIFHYLTKADSGFDASFGPLQDYALPDADLRSSKLSLVART